MPGRPRGSGSKQYVGRKRCGIKYITRSAVRRLSTIAAAIPVITLLVLIASGKVKAHIAAIIAVVVANLITIFIFTMPAGMSVRASLLGVVSGFFPIGWIVLNVIFLYQLTVRPDGSNRCKRAVGGVTDGPAAAAAADRLLVRRVLRGRRRLRHPGGGHGRRS